MTHLSPVGCLEHRATLILEEVSQHGAEVSVVIERPGFEWRGSWVGFSKNISVTTAKNSAGLDAPSGSTSVEWLDAFT
jgi:hypothetical protein